MDLGASLERDPETLAGAIRVKGTRLSVDFLLGLFEQGWTEQDVLASYPQLTPVALQAVFALARRSLQNEQLIPLAS
ncbi:MAG: DUF433 domain-containing protein [Candidatus Eremiobacteraeota bacterium]|nr:DUF433 domain-containing protein [Candidatus Eremiobacteraeota bacterium]